MGKYSLNSNTFQNISCKYFHLFGAKQIISLIVYISLNITNLDSIFKRRDITLPTKVRLVKAMAFPVVMYGCESWTIKKLSTKELMLLNCGVGEDS